MFIPPSNTSKILCCRNFVERPACSSTVIPRFCLKRTGVSVRYPIPACCLRHFLRIVFGQNFLCHQSKQSQGKHEDQNKRNDNRLCPYGTARLCPSALCVHIDRGVASNTIVAYALCCVFAVFVRFSAFHSQSPFLYRHGALRATLFCLSACLPPSFSHAYAGANNAQSRAELPTIRRHRTR